MPRRLSVPPTPAEVMNAALRVDKLADVRAAGADVVFKCFLPPAHPFLKMADEELFGLFGPHVAVYELCMIPRNKVS